MYDWLAFDGYLAGFYTYPVAIPFTIGGDSGWGD
jgi:hypothetical protein